MHSGFTLLLHATFYLSRDRPSVHVVPLGNAWFAHHAHVALGMEYLPIQEGTKPCRDIYPSRTVPWGTMLYSLQTKASLWDGGYLNGVVAENTVRNLSGYSGLKELSVQQNFPWSVCLVEQG